MSLNPTHRISRNVVNMYGGPSSSEELVSQAVMGAPVEALNEETNFTKIRTEDGYSGWVITRWLAAGSACPADWVDVVVSELIAELFERSTPQSRLLTKLPLGAQVYVDKSIGTSSEPGELTIVGLAAGEFGYIRPSAVSQGAVLPIGPLQPGGVRKLAERVAQYSFRFIGTPYLWGGCSPFGLDCSGFVQLIWRMNGLLLPRDADLQYADPRFGPVEQGSTMALTGLLPGDLVFFGRSNGSDIRVTHVGLAIGDGAFIHSAGGGRGNLVSACTDPAFADSFLGAKRLLPDANHSIDPS